MANHKNGKSLSQTSDRDGFTDTLLKLILELLSFVSAHSTRQGAGAAQWRGILSTIKTLCGSQGNETLLITLLHQLPWRLVWCDNTSQFIPTCVLAITLVEADILEAIVGKGSIHDVGITGKYQLQVKVKHDRDELVLNVPPGAVRLNGVAAEPSGFAGCLIYLKMVTQSAEPPESPGKDDLDVDYYDDEFVPAAEEML